MSDVVTRLYRTRGYVWQSMIPAIDHAIALAREADYEAERASNAVQAGIPPAYPPLVLMLADAAPDEANS